MRYRIGQILLNILGVLFIIGLVAPKPKSSGVGTAAAMGTVFGFVFSVMLIIVCFESARRLGKKAKTQARQS
ncbi:MAG: hypothetical protein ACRYFU_08785 [Janthinobacterium lividum]